MTEDELDAFLRRTVIMMIEETLRRVTQVVLL
jgi:hypothetical protein